MKMIIILLFLLMNYSHLNSNIWEETFFSSPDLPKDIECYDNNNCYILTDYASGGSETRIYKTTDAGASWELLNSIKELEVQDMSVPDSNNIYIAFNNGKTYHSIDAGKSFTDFRLDSVHSFPYMIMSNELIGAITNAYIIPNIFYILITKDGWKTYNKLTLDRDKIRFSFHYPRFINDSMLYAIVRVFDQREPQYQEPPVDKPRISGHINNSFMKLNINTLDYELFYID
ncbi:MAG: hypothetical protein KGZ71_02630 [Desulfobulbaceae bacterium]|nr:hypothetical protein [Desulfobulbaceae bacterium]